MVFKARMTPLANQGERLLSGLLLRFSIECLKAKANSSDHIGQSQDTDCPVNQSKLEAANVLPTQSAGRRLQTRENASKRVTFGFVLTSR